MKSYRYLIIGGGMAADSAVRSIREIDQKGSIGLVSQETDPPYDRPPLSKGLWKGKAFDSIWRNTVSRHVSLHLGRRIVSLDPDGCIALDDQGEQYQGEKILLVTGGKPRRLPFGGDDVIYYRTVEHYRKLSTLSADGHDFIVIGGGFIGAELAAALAMNGKNVTMLLRGDGIGARMYPHDLSQFVTEYYRKKGVGILTGLAGQQISGVARERNRFVLRLGSGSEMIADGLVAGVGINPNMDLARSAGLLVGNGIRVDQFLVTSCPNIYAAGDCSEFFNPDLGRLLHMEHEDCANSMGRQAGRNMAGLVEPYHYLPYFYSDLFELGYEAVGELDSRLQTAAHWAEPFQKGIIYYFKENRICGVLLWNVWDKVAAARELIAQPGPFRPEDLDKGKLPGWQIAY